MCKKFDTPEKRYSVCIAFLKTYGWTILEENFPLVKANKESRYLDIDGEIKLEFNAYYSTVKTTLEHPKRGLSTLVREIEHRKTLRSIIQYPTSFKFKKVSI